MPEDHSAALRTSVSIPSQGVVFADEEQHSDDENDHDGRGSGCVSEAMSDLPFTDGPLLYVCLA